SSGMKSNDELMAATGDGDISSHVLPFQRERAPLGYTHQMWPRVSCKACPWVINVCQRTDSSCVVGASAGQRQALPEMESARRTWLFSSANMCVISDNGNVEAGARRRALPPSAGKNHGGISSLARKRPAWVRSHGRRYAGSLSNPSYTWRH